MEFRFRATKRSGVSPCFLRLRVLYTLFDVVVSSSSFRRRRRRERRTRANPRRRNNTVTYTRDVFVLSAPLPRPRARAATSSERVRRRTSEKSFSITHRAGGITLRVFRHAICSFVRRRRRRHRDTRDRGLVRAEQ